MLPYWSDERGRYGTGESYEWFPKYPDGVETFESEAVFVPKSVKCLYEAFSDCENLKEVVLEDGVSKIDEYAFYHCINLREIVIPESVVEIEPRSVGIMEIREYTSADKMAYRMKGEQAIPGFLIKGVSGSAAEKYALENGILFVAMN